MEDKTVIAIIGGAEHKLDMYDLAGLNLTKEEKHILKEFGIDAIVASTLLNYEFEEQWDKFKELNLLKPIKYSEKSTKKKKNWDKKYFWE